MRQRRGHSQPGIRGGEASPRSSAAQPPDGSQKRPRHGDSGTVRGWIQHHLPEASGCLGARDRGDEPRHAVRIRETRSGPAVAPAPTGAVAETRATTTVAKVRTPTAAIETWSAASSRFQIFGCFAAIQEPNGLEGNWIGARREHPLYQTRPNGVATVAGELDNDNALNAINALYPRRRRAAPTTSTTPSMRWRGRSIYQQA